MLLGCSLAMAKASPGNELVGFPVTLHRAEEVPELGWLFGVLSTVSAPCTNHGDISEHVWGRPGGL